MTFDDLTTFITVAETKNFHRASEALFVSQSTISFRIKGMESQVGTQLIDRASKDFALTPAGKNFLTYAQQLSRLYEDGMRSVHLQSHFTSRLNIGAPLSLWDGMIFPALDEYLTANPNTSFKLSANHSWDLNNSISSGELDFGITLIPVKHFNITLVPLLKNPFVLVAHRDLDLPTHHMTPEDIQGLPFLFCHWGGAFDEWFRQYYYRGVYFMEVQESPLFLHMLEKKMGIGFMPLRIAKDYLQTGLFKRLSFDHADVAPLEEIYAMYKNQRSDDVVPILQHIQRYIAKEGLDAAYYHQYGLDSQ